MTAGEQLTPAEVEFILTCLGEYRPIVVGGQAIYLWSTLLGEATEDVLLSKDVDFYEDKAAARQLARSLTDAELRVAGPDEHTPSAAIVTGRLGAKTVTIDFMSCISGVSNDTLRKNAVVYNLRSMSQDINIQVSLIHPVDLLRFRLSNINTLGRDDRYSFRQAGASVRILDKFVRRMIEESLIKEAQYALMQVEDVCRRYHFGKKSHLASSGRLNIVEILDPYLDEVKLDERWRERTLKPSIARSRHRESIALR